MPKSFRKVALKYPVLIRNVNNLSDARYCAGMGVKIIGFNFSPDHAASIEEAVYQGIRGWITGVEIAVKTANLLDYKSLEPDYVLTEEEYSVNHGEIDLPVIYAFDINNVPEILPPKGSYLLVYTSNIEDKLKLHDNFIGHICKDFKVFLGFGFDENNIHEVHATFEPYGFALEGGHEIAPGLKTFEDLANILEVIEID